MFVAIENPLRNEDVLCYILRGQNLGSFRVYSYRILGSYRRSDLFSELTGDDNLQGLLWYSTYL